MAANSANATEMEKAILSPCSNGPAINKGKKTLPVRFAWATAGNFCNTCAGINVPIGLYPRNAAKSAAVGGSRATP